METVGGCGLVGMVVTDGVMVGLGGLVVPVTGPTRGFTIPPVVLLTEEALDGKTEGGGSGLSGRTVVCFPRAAAIGASGLGGAACFSMATGVGGSGLAGEVYFSMATDGSSLGGTCFPTAPPVGGSGLDGGMCLSTDTVVGGSGLAGGRCFSTARDVGSSGFEGGTCLAAPVGGSSLGAGSDVAAGGFVEAAVVGAHGLAVLPTVCGSGLLTGPLATAVATGFLSA